MKRIFKSMFLVASAVAVALNFASCKGDDGEDDNNNDDNVVIEDKDGVKYTVKISDLNDYDVELSYTVTYNFIAPEEAKVEYQNIFKYTFTADEPALADSTGEAKPETADVVKDSLLIVSWKVVITCSKEDYAQKMYDDMKADTTDLAKYATLEIDGKTIIGVFDDLEGLTYGMVKAMYEEEKAEIDSDIAKAKEAADANKNKVENKPEETKPNASAKNSRLDLTKDADETKKDSTSLTLTYVNASAGRGVAYNFKHNAEGTFESGTVVVAFKNADEAKAYAKSESRAKDENGDRIYKSVGVDGGNVVLAYSSKALAEMTEETAKALFNEKKKEIGASTPTTPEENNGENNGEENGENNGDEENNAENSENQNEEPANEGEDNSIEE
ncbi:MAG: hypothetical protein J6X32_10185 [Salinivirgaceae bacterium]|nr:hypothetical protein [Salinivirgaceae bacterium]